MRVSSSFWYLLTTFVFFFCFPVDDVGTIRLYISDLCTSLHQNQYTSNPYKYNSLVFVQNREKNFSTYLIWLNNWKIFVFLIFIWSQACQCYCRWFFFNFVLLLILINIWYLLRASQGCLNLVLYLFYFFFSLLFLFYFFIRISS